MVSWLHASDSAVNLVLFFCNSPPSLLYKVRNAFAFDGDSPLSENKICTDKLYKLSLVSNGLPAGWKRLIHYKEGHITCLPIQCPKQGCVQAGMDDACSGVINNGCEQMGMESSGPLHIMVLEITSATHLYTMEGKSLLVTEQHSWV